MTSTAMQLESLLPAAMVSLFRIPHEEDPLKHLSVGQIRLMRALLAGEQAATHVGATLDMSPSALTQMVGRLVSAGLVCKQAGDDDRRVRVLNLTEKGRELMTRRRAMRADHAAKVLRGFPSEKTRQLIDILREIAEMQQANVDITEVLV